jgi:hypothetical protein
MKSQTTRYGFPPLLEAELPETIPWDVPIHELSGLWLTVVCGGCGTTSQLPLRLMAAEQGWDRTLRQIVPKLRCRNCSGLPSKLELLVNPADQGFKVGRPQRRLDLLA